MLDFLLLIEIGIHGTGQQNFLFGRVFGVGAGKYRYLFMIDLYDLGADPVHKITVVGDQNNSSPVIGQIIF